MTRFPANVVITLNFTAVVHNISELRATQPGHKVTAGQTKAKCTIITND